DSTLLGAWAEPGDAVNILDVGTGTGVLSLMLAQKSKAKIHAIEPDLKAFELASYNANQSRWKNRITVIHSRIQDYEPKAQYDFVVSNPPFYEPYLRFGKYSPTEERRKIRSHEGLGLDALLEHALRLLLPRG